MVVELLAGLDRIALLKVLNYTLLSCSGVGVTFLNLSYVFPWRHGPLVFWAYFVTKPAIDASLLLAMASTSDAATLGSLNEVWTLVTHVTSLFVVIYTFKGDYVQVGLCAIASDAVAGMLLTLTLTLSNVAVGLPTDAGFLVAPSPRTLVCIALILGMACLLRGPVSWVLHFLARVALRHRFLWLGLVLIFIVGNAAAVAGVAHPDTLSSRFSYNTPFMLGVLLLLSLLVLQRRHDVVRREEAVSAVTALARSYDRAVGEQLAELGRDRVALEGHEHVLSRLGEGMGDARLARRVSGLERTYRRLSAGNYCAEPALDAVLTSCAGRLQAVGVEPTFTVAGVPTDAVVPTPLVFTLLNLALEAAERATSVEGSKVDLRIRGVGEQLFLRLDVPARWGALGVRRFLSPHVQDRAAVIRERRRADRMLVLVIVEVQRV